MSALNATLQDIAKIPGTKLKERLFAELTYAKRLSDAFNGQYDQLITEAIEAVKQSAQSGALVDADVYAVERLLAPMADAAKRYRILCVGHAHIDMNWMWRYDETVSITLETFRTMLNLMEQFPQFTFAQSQASVYRIVEEFEPEMLPKIRAAIKRNQWEVTASTWVEADRNLPSAESVARQMLYAKRYLPQLLDIDAAQLNIDYEPDTFGHGRFTPGLLTQGGVKYAYHCRGFEEHTLYRWRDPSGAEVIMYREPYWYLGPIAPDMAYAVPGFCESQGISSYLKVYGVGDHGGGPTRRDIERITDMATWPIFPRVEFGTYAAFFAEVESVRSSLPIVDRELNYVFTGCYTTQTRIKMGNRIAERWLSQAETMQGISAVALKTPYDHAKMEAGWRNVLFNQFHDIIPGSGVIDTREHAMGLYQQTYALAGTQTMSAARAFASHIDTSAFPAPAEFGDTAQGAGVGYGVYAFGPSRVERGGGNSRIVHVFNTTNLWRNQLIEVTLWDWRGETDRLGAIDAHGAVLPIQITDAGHNSYWQHDFMTLYVKVAIPAFGYTTFSICEKDSVDAPNLYPKDARVHLPYVFELKNDQVRAKFDPKTGQLSEFALMSEPTRVIGHGGFRLIDEEHMPNAWGSAWIVGRYREITSLRAPIEMLITQNGELRQELTVKYAFRASTLTVKYAIEEGNAAVKVAMICDWHERGTQVSGIPQLQYCFTLTQSPKAYLCDVPGGVIEREPLAMDVPCQSFMAASQAGGAVGIIADTKYGFRGDDDAIMLTLIRSSYDPDPSPEYGEHKVQFALQAAAYSAPAFVAASQKFCVAPFTLSGTYKHGELPLEASFMSTSSDHLMITAVKQAEDSRALLIRFQEITGKPVRTALTFIYAPRTARFVDLNETPVGESLSIEGNKVLFDAPLLTTSTIAVTF